MRCCVGVGVGVGVVGGGVLEWVECSETHTHSLTHARTTNEWPFTRLKHPLSVFVTSRFVCSFVRLLRCCCSLQCCVLLSSSPSLLFSSVVVVVVVEPSVPSLLCRCVVTTRFCAAVLWCCCPCCVGVVGSDDLNACVHDNQANTRCLR